MRTILTLLFAFICLSRAEIVDVSYNNIDYESDSFLRCDPNIQKKFKPDWKDLDTRPLPEWYDRAKIGIFLHWGIFSVPSFHSEWFWIYWTGGKSKDINNFMKKNYPPGFTYQDFGPQFTAEFFDPKEWAELFAKSGANYVVLTSKHHEGYTLFPSRRSFSWNSVDVGPHRDLLGELATAVRKQGLKFGAYHSLFEWFNPIYLQDKLTSFTENTYTTDKLWPDIKQLVNEYNISVLWSDGDWEARDTYWKSTELLAWLYNESPVKDEIVVNDRWGIDIPGHHGDFYNHADRYNPGVLLNHKWENAFTIDAKSWGYRRNLPIKDVLTIKELLYQVVSTVSCGGNVLINVGPTKEGTIVPIFQERLLQLGQWLSINGEAIYGSSPWHYQNDTINGQVWYTCSKPKYNACKATRTPTSADKITAIYAIFLQWPKDSVLKLRNITPFLHSGTSTELLGVKGTLNWKISNGNVSIQLPDKATVQSENAWTIKFTKL